MRIAIELLDGFARRTGIAGAGLRRYLWTDAFAVCNFLGLGRIEEAVSLVDRVHSELGRHRADDLRRGWISGLPERARGEPIDVRLEWDRDGQYFHYLTKWMHALARVAAATGDDKYLRWARELADSAFQRFVARSRMYWKMSIDLSRPQVASMGHHDPLDGYVTALELGLPAIAAEYRAMIDVSSLATSDALGIGGLLVDAHRLDQLALDQPLRDALLAAGRLGIAHFTAQPDLRLTAVHRLAFRELGLAIGLSATHLSSDVRDRIESFWLADAHRATRTYREHQDINDVMLATSLAPQGFLALTGTRDAA